MLKLITTAQATKLADAEGAHVTGVYALAAILGITRQAVEAWGKYPPALRQHELKAARPEWFEQEVKR